MNILHGWSQVVGQIILCLFITAQILVSAYMGHLKWKREEKSRNDERIDRIETAKALHEAQRIAAEALARITAAEANRIIDTVREAHKEIEAKLIENTEVNEKALSSANNFNAKFASLAKSEQEDLIAKKLDNVEDVTIDTNRHVRSVESKVDQARQLQIGALETDEITILQGPND